MRRTLTVIWFRDNAFWVIIDLNGRDPVIRMGNKVAYAPGAYALQSIVYEVEYCKVVLVEF